jgi:ABC-type transporter Mla subunit MlaD
VRRLPSPHAWVRSVLIGLAVFAAWLVLSVATYQEGPDDTPVIVALFSK